MRKTTMATIVALGLSFSFGISMLGIGPLATPITASALANDGLGITLMHPVEGRTFWYGGAVMPVVVSLSDNGNAVTDANVTLWVNGAAASGPGKAMVGNSFVNLGEGLYQFNLNTKPYPAGPGSEPITVEVMASVGSISATLEFSMVLH